jgi:hypothetical protein
LGCTGTLIHPRVVTTAAHCEPHSNDLVVFGEAFSPARISVRATKCVTSGRSPDLTRDDWAYCVLPDDDRLKNLPILPPLVGCEAERFLKANAKVWVVGFGVTASDRVDFGPKRAVETSIFGFGTGVDEGGIIVGDGLRGGCHGDSGGPVFLHLIEDGRDWGFRAVGMTHGSASDKDCEGPGVWNVMTDVVAHIEKDEGLDVTPCTNASGEWEPGPACRDFPTDPGNAGGSWPACAPGPRTTMPIDSCGLGAADAGPPDASGPRDAAADRTSTDGASMEGNAGRSGSPDAATGGAAGSMGGGGAGPTSTGGHAGSTGGEANAGNGGTRGATSGELDASCSCALHRSADSRASAALAFTWIFSMFLNARARRRRSDA